MGWSKFTFQYGSIQITYCRMWLRGIHNLHSNMVLFKWYLKRPQEQFFSIYIPIWFYSNKAEDISFYTYSEFTFQYGSIQMISKKTARAVLFWFTFQYGSIQMDFAIQLLKKAGYVFTFQYGSIQIKW